MYSEKLCDERHAEIKRDLRFIKILAAGLFVEGLPLLTDKVLPYLKLLSVLIWNDYFCG